jgi:hypothetical protein
MPDSKRYEDKIPFRFILDYLVGVDIIIKPMFGCHGIYANGRLCLFLMNRDRPLIRRESDPMQKGIYVATTTDHAEQLKRVFSDAEFELLKEKKVWIFISDTSEKFEQYVIAACGMISSGDPRIGR